MRSGVAKMIRMLRWHSLCIVLILLVGCAQMTRPSQPLPKDPSLEELLVLYQREREAIPPLKGLMKVTITDSIDTGFWAKWRSWKGAIEIDGFNLLGGTLFKLKLEGSEASLVSAEDNFKGNRQALEQYLMAHHSEIRMEWLTLLDWVARGGLPDLSVPDRPALRKEADRKGSRHLVLSFPKQDIWIERKWLRIKDVVFHDLDDLVRIRFDDYRPVGKTARGGRTTFPFFIKIEAQSRQMEIVFKELKVMAE